MSNLTTMTGAYSTTAAYQTVVPVGGQMSVQDKRAHLVAGGDPIADGSLTLTDEPEEVEATGAISVTGTFSLADGKETVIVSGKPIADGTMTLEDTKEALSATGETQVEGTLAVIDEPEDLDVFEEAPPRLAVIEGTLTDQYLLDSTLT